MGGLLVRESQAFQTSEQKLAAQRGTMAYQILKTHNKGDEQNMRLRFDNSGFLYLRFPLCKRFPDHG